MSKAAKRKTDKEEQKEAMLKAAKNGGFDSFDHFKKAVGKKDPPKKKK